MGNVQIDRDALIRGHVGHVYKLARGFRFSASGPFSGEDLVSAGLEALVECARRYDPAMVQNEDWPGNVDCFWGYANARVRGAMQDAIRGWFHWDRRLETSPESPCSIEELSGSALEPEATEVPSTIEVWEAVQRLPAREAEVLVRHAFGERLVEIGERLGVSESRVKQIESEAHERFRSWGYVDGPEEHWAVNFKR